MPETEEIYSSFLGIPIQRLGEKLGLWLCTTGRIHIDEIYALEVVAMVIAEMTELGAFVGEETGLKALHQQAVMFRGATAQRVRPKATFCG